MTLEGVWQLLIGAALLVFPGYAAISILRPRIDFGPIEELCLALGLSIGIVPLALYVSTLVGLVLTPAWAASLLAAAALASAGRIRHRWLDWRANQTGKLPAAGLALGLIFLGSLVARLLAVKGIAYPLWTDSYHHTMIAQLIVDTGRVPSSFEPYAPIHDFTYHFGFHALVAWFHWLTGVPVPRSVVVVGQVVNALVVPTTYLMGWRLFQDRLAGLVAAFITGLISHMPALFVNWGRYTQLSGQILLPAVIVLTLETLERQEPDTRLGILAGLSLAGLFLVHNRITLFFLVFAGLYTLARFPSSSNSISRKALLVGVGCIALTALVVDGPWIWRFFSGFGGVVVRQLVSGYQPQAFGGYFDWQLVQFVDHGARLGLWIFAGLGVVWGLIRRNRSVWLIFLWTLCLFAAANVNLIGIRPVFSTYIVIIWVYLPVALCIGFLSGRVYHLARARTGIRMVKYPVMELIAVVGLTLAGIAQVRYIAGLTEPQNGFVREADLEAMHWVRQNIPEDALFSIKAFFWTPTGAHGLDAGYWLPLLTGRETIIPPETYPSDGSAQYVSTVNKRIRALNDLTKTGGLWRVMQEYRITHIYMGNRPTDFDPEFFLEDPEHFELLYAKDDVWIFKVVG